MKKLLIIFSLFFSLTISAQNYKELSRNVVSTGDTTKTVYLTVEYDYSNDGINKKEVVNLLITNPCENGIINEDMIISDIEVMYQSKLANLKSK